MSFPRNPFSRASAFPAPPALWSLLATLALSTAPLAAMTADGPSAVPERSSVAGEPLDGIQPFNDLQPSDWAYQALAALLTRYDCVAGFPAGNLRGQRTLSRYEAAALLLACLDRVTEITDERKALSQSFASELALLQARADGFGARLGELEASAFSTTTRLHGNASLVLGANSFSGTATDLVRGSRAAFGATTLNTDWQFTLDTSFTGKDLLRANLRAGNFGGTSFGGAGPTSLSQLEVAFQEDLGPTPADGRDLLTIDRLYYQTPIGPFTLTAGGRVGQEDMLAIWPSVYPAETVLDVLTLPGSPAAYNKNLGAGAGLSWQEGGLAISANYVAANGNGGQPSQGGIATTGAGGTGTVQIGYVAEQWAIAALYSRIQNGNDVVVYATNVVLESFRQPGATSAFALSGYWQPASAGWVPSISGGWGITTSTYTGRATDGLAASLNGERSLVRASQSWSVGLQWLDALLPGNALGLAVGQPTFATRLNGGALPHDGNVVWEGWYQFRLTDNISLTPAIFYLSRPLGQATPAGESFQQLGGLLRTTVRY
ncbi:MAG: iron uptake porin [Cyanobacteriota bacterium]